MSACARCQSLIDDEHIPTEDHAYNVGDIVGIQESVHGPVRDIFNRGGSRRSSTTASARSTRTREWDKKGGRPAVVLERRLISNDVDEAQVLLFATYKGDYRLRQLLPLVLQMFCIAVYPHSEIETDPYTFHLHTHPEWSNSKTSPDDLHAWLIALPFTSRGKISGR
ncbi:hypothetical protein C8Q76DRAFT_709402 [Earliella scabrosa]|nr:hypothetical protein C8Q76DRAFT_709402 [Earliella scabrosa]